MVTQPPRLHPAPLEPTETNEGTETMPMTAVDLRVTLAKLSAAADAAGINRAFRYLPGRKVMGIQHVLEEYRDESPIPHIIKIGATFAEADRFLEGMVAGIDVIRREQALSASQPALPKGLCPIRSDHQPHEVQSASLGWFWCHADQSKRQPYLSEQARRTGKPLPY